MRISVAPYRPTANFNGQASNQAGNSPYSPAQPGNNNFEMNSDLEGVKSYERRSIADAFSLPDVSILEFKSLDMIFLFSLITDSNFF